MPPIPAPKDDAEGGCAQQPHDNYAEYAASLYDTASHMSEFNGIMTQPRVSNCDQSRPNDVRIDCKAAKHSDARPRRGSRAE